MKENDSQTKSTGIRHQQLGTEKGLVMTEDSWLQNQPKETVLLFPGAVTTTTRQETEPQQRLVVHCDGCQNEIDGKIFSCKNCFDYDLCGVCYPSTSRIHANGQHEFAAES